MAGQPDTITAQGRVDPNQNTGISIYSCSIKPKGNVAGVRIYLGRPWKPYSVTVYMKSAMAGIIDPTRWLPWSGNSTPDTIFYVEYRNTGPGSSTKNRVKWKGVKTMTAAQADEFTVAPFVGGNSWLPKTGVPFTPGMVPEFYWIKDGHSLNSGFGCRLAPAVRLENKIPDRVFRQTEQRTCGQILAVLRLQVRQSDNGFDPLGLAEDPENLKWFVQAELVNGRWAMLGVAGMLLPEVFTKIGIINVPEWYDAGKAEYFASSSTLFVIEFILFHYVEIRRWQDIKNPGSVNQDPIFKSYSLPPNEVGYPGGIFNPLNFAPTLESKEKELANGRLAMLAFLAFVIQHNVTGKGPFENLLQHLSDPWHNTIIQTLGG
ncbi:hypothetical protein GW17_00048435 [Ensete ventricosum]|nr:hypothetical protein GW17_00048435 [Ensete ventricosum]